MSFVLVSDTNNGDEKDIIELPLEEDDTLLLSTLQAQYTDASGLKFVATDSGRTRAVRVADQKLYPPSGGWSDVVYLCSMKSFSKENKQKIELNTETTSHKQAPKEPMVESKSETKTKPLATPMVESKSESKAKSKFKPCLMEKCVHGVSTLHVAYPRGKVTKEDLQSYFKKFGKIIKILVHNYTPKCYAFVKFVNSDSVVKVLHLGHNHFFKGVQYLVHVAFHDKYQRCAYYKDYGVQESHTNNYINNCFVRKSKNNKKPNNSEFQRIEDINSLKSQLNVFCSPPPKKNKNKRYIDAIVGEAMKELKKIYKF